jgi:hypothetical protein
MIPKETSHELKRAPREPGEVWVVGGGGRGGVGWLGVVGGGWVGEWVGLCVVGVVGCGWVVVGGGGGRTQKYNTFVFPRPPE